MTTLISFLGKSQLDSRQGYRTVRYRFPNGQQRETAYLGLALAEHLQVGRILLLGTPSSMWDLLVESTVGDGADEALRLELMEAVRAGSVTEALLEALRPALQRRMGRPVATLLIPYATDFADQQALLERLADQFARGERAVLDVTHGFRHLAMLGLSAARYLAHAGGVSVEAIYYGALDMTVDGITPVVELSGLAHVQEWAESLAAVEASGDLTRLAPLLERDGLPPEHVKALVRGWQLLGIMNVADAARTLRPVVRALDEPLKGAAQLYQEQLIRHLRWVKANGLHEQLRLLALQALRRGDLLRTALLGLESFLAREVVNAGGDPLDYRARERAAEQFKQDLREGKHPEWKRSAYKLLNNVRNALAHATRPSHDQHAELMQNPERLRRELEATLSRLTNTPA
ncbi:TIGR02221 family CRISPR-associated protein [Tepidicella xavieri]|uniref:CRISPR-associated Csx2 family protein n=1 Tax=Tepidicella xavieri TaxID=360241 RepID=A0A4R6UGJ6_9BURK|nr:TIGR02221 family CRISPR-associated protein [Tepidicella xavieri]TDQ44389.1 CRISPR-associated Csx2 family protein [Tepidicella xavieri]